MAGGYGNTPWGGLWGGGFSPSGVEPLPTPEHIPNSTLWTQFDLRGVRRPNDMDLVLSYIECSAFGEATQFFVNSFNMASGGAFPTTPAFLDVDVPVTETFSVEYRLSATQLPEDFDDPVNRHILLAVNNAGGACATLLLSKAGIAYTGAVSFDGVTYEVSFDHILNPEGVTLTQERLFIIPGSDVWFDEAQDIYVRLVVDWEQELVYLFVTPAADVTEGVSGADSTGHILRVLLPILPADTAETPPIDRIAISVRGTVPDEANLELFHYNLTSRLLVPNLPPRAITGPDQAARLCSIVQLDGTASFDPEGVALGYEWRLTDAPDTSFVTILGELGHTEPDSPPTGFTGRFFSEGLEAAHELEPIVAGDVLRVGGTAYTIASVKPEGAPGEFYLQLTLPQLPDNISGTTFKVFRQSGVTGKTTARPTFYPDVAGFYVFDLRVFDGTQWSSPDGLQRAVTVVNVLESPLPRGCTPDLSFIYDYLSDFWSLVEDREKMHVFWGGLAQVAAAELYTLWQIEYSKSIRDIQRTIARRWLHYDLALGEPVPELTKVRPLWGGVTSEVFVALFVHNRRLGLSSPFFENDLVVTFTGIDPADPVSFAAGLERQLRLSQDSFRVSVLSGSVGQQLRITAGFPFSVTDQTTSLWTVGDTNGTLIGLGEATAGRAFKTDRSLEGLELESTFLVVAGVAYTILRTVDDPGDDFRYQRVVLARDLDSELGVEVPYRISGWVSSELLNFYEGLVSEGDVVEFEVSDAQPSQAPGAPSRLFLVETRAYGASSAYPSRLPVDFGPVGQYMVDPTLVVRLARVTRRTYVPVDTLVVDVPTLQEKVVVEDDTQTLRRNLDYFIGQYRGQSAIRFVSGQGGGPDVFEGLKPPQRLWAEYTYVSNLPAVSNNFGELVGLTLDQAALLPAGVDYVSAVAGLMYVYSNGPTMRNTRVGAQILLGLPFAEEDGTIVEIRADLLSTQARLLIRDTQNAEIVRSYTYPKVLDLEENPATGLPYAVGDTVVRFAPLVRGAEVLDYVKDPTWFQGIVTQGVFNELQKYHTFSIRVDSRAFSVAVFPLVRDFVLTAKPVYTTPLFVVTLLVSGADGDEISVNDEVSSSGFLFLEDAVCAGRLGASYMFDQPWPGGGQPWAGDTGNNHNQRYRNSADSDDDPFTTPVFPTSEQVAWAADQERLCPDDEVGAYLEEDFPGGLPEADSIFAVDLGVLELLTGDVAGPISIPSGALGLDIPLVSGTIINTGEIQKLRLILQGATTGGTALFELLLRINGTTVEVVPFEAGINTEVIAVVSHAVTAGDTVEVRVRTASNAADTPGWTLALAKVENYFPWFFDVVLPAGTYNSYTELS